MLLDYLCISFPSHSSNATMVKRDYHEASIYEVLLPRIKVPKKNKDCSKRSPTISMHTVSNLGTHLRDLQLD